MSPLHPHRQTTNSPFSRSPLPSMTLPSWNFIVPVSPSLSGRQINLSAFTLFKLWCLSVSEINMVWYWCDSCRIYVHEQLLSTQFVPVCLPWQRLFCEYLLKRAVTHSKRFFSFHMVSLMGALHEALESDLGLLSEISKKDQRTDRVIWALQILRKEIPLAAVERPSVAS